MITQTPDTAGEQKRDDVTRSGVSAQALKDLHAIAEAVEPTDASGMQTVMD